MLKNLLACAVALLLFAACGRTIGKLDSLPDIPVAETAPWPRLVDTPQPPEARLTAGTGGAVLTTLTERNAVIQGRQQTVRSVSPAPDSLRDRVAQAEARRVAAGSAVDEQALASRGAAARQRAAAPKESFLETGSSPAPAETRQRTSQPAVSPDFEAAARRALERAERARRAQP